MKKLRNIVLVSNKSGRGFDYSEILKVLPEMEVKAHAAGQTLDDFILSNFKSEAIGFLEFAKAYINVALKEEGSDLQIVNMEFSTVTDTIMVIQNRIVLPTSSGDLSARNITIEVLKSLGYDYE